MPLIRVCLTARPIENKNRTSNEAGEGMRLSAIQICEARTHSSVPVFVCRVPAGFPSPADDYLDHPLDFNELLITHPAATFAVRIAGESMTGIGIFPGDIAVVDRAITAGDGAVILGILDGEFTIKRYRRKGSAVWLEAANPAYAPVPIGEERAFEVWGVVRHVIRRL
jgi:DNA polymerase V